MEQKDYLLREIEKIGMILNYIMQRFFGGKGDSALTTEQQFENEKEMLLSEINFDVDNFVDFDVEKSMEYLSNFAGFNVENTEDLAEYLFYIGINQEKNNSKKYLEKSLWLYELCNLKGQAYSFEREKKMRKIRETFVTI